MPTDNNEKQTPLVIPFCWQGLNTDVKNIFRPGPLNTPEFFNGNFFVPGKENVLRNKICSLIGSAEKMICVSSFIIDDKEVESALTKSINKGIDVYILTSHFKFLKNDKNELKVDEDVDDEKSLKQHEKLMNKFAGKAFLRSAGYIHSKFIIVDPHSKEGPHGMLLTPNLKTNELCENTDIAMLIDGQYAKDIFYQFCIGFWNESEQELFEPGLLSHTTENSNIKVPPLKTIHQTYYTSSKTQSNLKNRIIDLINNSKGPIKVSSYGYELENEVMGVLLAQLKDRRSVKVFARPRYKKPKTEESLKALTNAGAEVFGIMNLHAKIVLVGEEKNMKAILMTSNIEHRGLDEGFETGILIEGKKAQYLNNILIEWEKLAHFKLLTNVDITSLDCTYMVWNNHILNVTNKN